MTTSTTEGKIELGVCAECGMACSAGEFHPYAACLMFKACHNSKTVRDNLAALSTPKAEQAEPCGNRDYCSRHPFCGCGSESALPERDLSKSAEEQGLFRKFIVQRADGTDAPGGKHEGCEYFVLDVDHDQHAPAALVAYAQACKDTHPQLSAELAGRFAQPPLQTVEVPTEPAIVGWFIEDYDAHDNLITSLAPHPLTDDVYLPDTAEAHAVCKLEDALAYARASSAQVEIGELVEALQAEADVLIAEGKQPLLQTKAALSRHAHSEKAE